MLSITAPTRLPTSWTPAVPPPACDTIGELLETQEHFSSTPTPWNSKQARPAGLACLQYQNKCFRLLCDRCRGVHPVFVATFWIRMSRPPELHGFEIFSKKRKKPVCTVLHGRLCIPPEHPSYNKIVVFIDRSPAECYNSFRVLWIGEALLPQRRFLGGSNHSFLPIFNC